MARVFNYEQAATILAEADLFGDEPTAKRWGVGIRSVERYRSRATTDAKMAEFVGLKKRILVCDWQSDATKTIKIALTELNRRIPLAKDEADAKVIHSIAGACKIVGELKITAEALNEPTTNS